MIPSHREIADAEHEDHMARLEALREPPRKSLVPVVVMVSALVGLCVMLAWGAVLVLGVFP